MSTASLYMPYNSSFNEQLSCLLHAYFQAYFILDEFLLAGEIQETSKKCVLNAIKLQVLSNITRQHDQK